MAAIASVQHSIGLSETANASRSVSKDFWAYINLIFLFLKLFQEYMAAMLWNRLNIGDG